MSYILQYNLLLVFILFSVFLSLVLLLLSLVLSPQLNNFEKSTSYECGFEPFGDARGSLNIQFYVVGVLFIIFDLEVVFLLPWSLTLGNFGLFSFWLMMFFLGVLTLGFVYEWRKGALNWV